MELSFVLTDYGFGKGWRSFM